MHLFDQLLESVQANVLVWKMLHQLILPKIAK
jgi:hypothetical protein